MKIRNLAQNNLDASSEQVVGSLQAAAALQIIEGAQSTGQQLQEILD